ncbi:unnamed protein product [Neospora caninum Liverpool]|uniref:Uncharacterized protein n=1 Tax=Neospora caninum (strain Liverpool) TaxID=572307 RepID=F0V9U1_NEOCL|nr:uncharacterized protein NCLIV_011700 [Neospora caninum Liverpool]CBZ50703.1 unnamed protein product [Neospora caninum Liverpool]|eukprot:XP_003880736.1 uncharacterized protein NCLIV_011700 [Neospora caninum Liverpool]
MFIFNLCGHRQALCLWCMMCVTRCSRSGKAIAVRQLLGYVDTMTRVPVRRPLCSISATDTLEAELPPGGFVDLSAIKDSEKKEMFRKGKQACLAVPRSATMKDIKEQIKFVLENQQQKLSLFKDGAHLKDKHTFEDDAFFPQIKGVIRQKGMTTGSAFATAHPVTKDDVIATILVRCPTRLTRVEITDGISILIQGISNEYVVERQLDTAMPHFWKKGEQSSELVLFIDREWCGAAIDALLKFHTKISEPNLEVGGSVVPKDGFLDDRDTYPTALIDARLKVCLGFLSASKLLKDEQDNVLHSANFFPIPKPSISF